MQLGNKAGLHLHPKLISPFIAIILFQSNCFSQYWYPRVKAVTWDKIPALHIQLKKTRPDTTRVNILLDLANAMCHKKQQLSLDRDSCVFFADSAYRLSTQLDYDRGINIAVLLLADAYPHLTEPKDPDKLLTKTIGDTAKIDLLLMRVYLLYLSGDEEQTNKATRYAGQARLLAKKNGLRAKEIQADLILNTRCYGMQDSTSEKYLLKAIEQYKAIGYPYLHTDYYRLTYIYSWYGNTDKALFYANEAVKSMEKANDIDAASDMYLTLAWQNYSADEYETSLDYCYKALNAYRTLPALFSIEHIAEWTTKNLRRLKRYNEALDFMTTIQKEFPANNNSQKILYIKLTAHIYRDMKQYQDAERYFLQMKSLYEKENMVSADLFVSLAQLYVESQQYKKAEIYLNRLSEFPGSSFNKGSRHHIQYMKFLTDSARGDYLSAIRQHNEIIQDDEVRQREAREKELDKLSIQYQTEKKASQIALLQKSARIQEAKLSQAKQLRNFTIAATGMILFILLLLYRLYWLKQKNIKEVTKIHDIIEEKNRTITEKKATLEQLVEEKEWLLKEVHHRVKNNLHTVICLLESQAAYLKDEALTAIKDSQHRIYAMSVIHQKLYQTDAKTIDMNPYIRQLTTYLEESFGSSERIHFFLYIDNITLNATQAIPVALIINEAVTNSIKYAFPDNRNGEISITLGSSGDHIIRLLLSDNGIGIDPSILTGQDSGSIGIQLIRGLGKEIHANIKIENANGTRIEVVFEQDLLSRSEALSAGGKRVA